MDKINQQIYLDKNSEQYTTAATYLMDFVLRVVVSNQSSCPDGGRFVKLLLLD